MESYLNPEFKPEDIAEHSFEVKEFVENRKREGYEDRKYNTVFGRILRGRLPAKVVYEDDVCLGFYDISPASDNHVLIIPKDFISHIGYLKKEHQPLVERMHAVAKALALKYEGKHSIGYHKWPLISVYHLHLHVISPMPANSMYQNFFKSHYLDGRESYFLRHSDISMLTQKKSSTTLKLLINPPPPVLETSSMTNHPQNHSQYITEDGSHRRS